MSSNNNDNSGIAMVVGLAAAAMMVLWIAIFAFFSFLAFVFTVLSLMAWNKPLHFGRWVITPAEAHAFIKRGVVGAFVLPAFCFFVEAFLGVNINWDYLPYLIISGYALGSVGIEMMIQHDLEQQQAAVAQQAHTQQLTPIIQHKQLPGPSQPKEPFTYATWDDEEERN